MSIKVKQFRDFATKESMLIEDKRMAGHCYLLCREHDSDREPIRSRLQCGAYDDARI
jgi:hypothetical protein